MFFKLLWATKRCYLFCNICFERSWIAMFCVLPMPSWDLSVAANQVLASGVNTDYWLDKIRRESRHFNVKQVFFRPVKRATYLLLQKIELLSSFYNNFSQPATTRFVARQVWFVAGKTLNSAIQLVLQQLFKTSCTFLSPVYSFFTVQRIGHFPVSSGLCIKTRLSARPLIWTEMIIYSLANN